MALDYDKRIDFRAFDVLADGITNATPAELAHAIESCDEIARNWTHGTNHDSDAKRLLFRGFANLMRLYLRRYQAKSKLWQQSGPAHTRGL